MPAPIGTLDLPGNQHSALRNSNDLLQPLKTYQGSLFNIQEFAAETTSDGR